MSTESQNNRLVGTSNLNEHELIEKLRNKDANATSLLYDTYAAALYGVILRIVKSHSKAEAILETTFIKCLDNVSVLGKHISLFTCLLQTARSAALKEVTAEALPAVKEEAVNELPQIDAAEYSELVEGLDSQCGEVVKHLYMEGHSLAQTAQALDIPVEKVKTQLRCALTHFSNLIKQNPTIALNISVVSLSIKPNVL